MAIEIGRVRAAMAGMVDSHPRVRAAIRGLQDTHGLSEPRARRVVERLLEFLVFENGEFFARSNGARIDRILNLRSQLNTALESVLAGHGLPDGLTPESLGGLFERLATEMRQLESPERFTQRPEGPRADLASATLEPPANVSPRLQNLLGNTGNRAGTLASMPAPRRAVIERLVTEVPDMVRAAVENPMEGGWTRSVRPERILEIAHWMSRNGFSEADIQAARQGLSDLNVAFNEEALRARVTDRGAYDASTVQGRVRIEAIERMEARARELQTRRATDPSKPLSQEELDLVNAMVNPEFTGLMRSNARIAELAHEAPQRLTAYWREYLEYRSGRDPAAGRRGFGEWISGRERTELRGAMGEFDAPFRGRMQGHDYLKGPDHNVLQRGTDSVSVERATGDIWQMDNKAVNEATMGGPSSLTTEYPRNLAQDATQARQTVNDLIANNQPVPQHIADAANRLEQASIAVGNYMASHPNADLASPAVQAEITARIRPFRIHRAVTNSWGALNDLSSGWHSSGIEFRNLN